MQSGWLVRFGDGRVLTRDEVPGLGYFQAVNRDLAVAFGIVANGSQVWETPEIPLAYRRRVQFQQGGKEKCIVHVVVFQRSVVWLFEKEGRIVVGPTFGNKEPFGPIVPVDEQERALIAHHLAETPKEMNFISAEDMAALTK